MAEVPSKQDEKRTNAIKGVQKKSSVQGATKKKEEEEVVVEGTRFRNGGS